jgi:hypothetical protein
MGLRALDLVEAFAQLRFDVLKIKRLVDVGLGSRCDDFAAAAQALRGERHAHRGGAAFQLLKVARRAGGKQQVDPEPARIGEVDRHFAGRDHLGRAGDLFYLGNQSKV